MGEKKRKFKYFGHYVLGGKTARSVMEGGMQERRGRGRPQGNWMGNLRNWSGEGGSTLTRTAEYREGWRQAVHSWVHQRSPRLRSYDDDDSHCFGGYGQNSSNS